MEKSRRLIQISFPGDLYKDIAMDLHGKETVLDVKYFVSKITGCPVSGITLKANDNECRDTVRLNKRHEAMHWVCNLNYKKDTEHKRLKLEYDVGRDFVKYVVNMGFPKNQVIAAINYTKGDKDKAIALLNVKAIPETSVHSTLPEKIKNTTEIHPLYDSMLGMLNRVTRKSSKYYLVWGYDNATYESVYQWLKNSPKISEVVKYLDELIKFSEEDYRYILMLRNGELQLSEQLNNFFQFQTKSNNQNLILVPTNMTAERLLDETHSKLCPEAIHKRVTEKWPRISLAELKLIDLAYINKQKNNLTDEQIYTKITKSPDSQSQSEPSPELPKQNYLESVSKLKPILTELLESNLRQLPMLSANEPPKTNQPPTTLDPQPAPEVVKENTPKKQSIESIEAERQKYYRRKKKVLTAKLMIGPADQPPPIEQPAAPADTTSHIIQLPAIADKSQNKNPVDVVNIESFNNRSDTIIENPANNTLIPKIKKHVLPMAATAQISKPIICCNDYFPVLVPNVPNVMNQTINQHKEKPALVENQGITRFDNDKQNTASNYNQEVASSNSNQEIASFVYSSDDNLEIPLIDVQDVAQPNRNLKYSLCLDIENYEVPKSKESQPVKKLNQLRFESNIESLTIAPQEKNNTFNNDNQKSQPINNNNKDSKYADDDKFMNFVNEMRKLIVSDEVAHEIYAKRGPKVSWAVSDFYRMMFSNEQM